GTKVSEASQKRSDPDAATRRRDRKLPPCFPAPRRHHGRGPPSRTTLPRSAAMTDLTRRRFLHAAPLAGAVATVPSARADQPKTPAAAPLKSRVGTVPYNIAKDWDLPPLLKVCKATGLAAVELRTPHKHGVEPSLGSDARREVKK